MSNLLGAVQTFVSENKQEIAIGAIGTTAGIALGAGTALALTSKKRKKSSKKKKSTKRRSKKKSKRNKRKYYPEPRGRKHSRRKIRMTKTGQPYIILASGKARFIKRSSARRSRRLKGGRY